MRSMRDVRCLYCHALILGVQYVPDYPNVFVLYAHKASATAKGDFMDPNAVWKCLYEALKDLEKWPNNADTRAHVVDCLHVLSRWVYSGGFPPDVTQGLHS